MKQPISQTEFAGLQLVKRGKVRDMYDVGEHLLMVASDRISASLKWKHISVMAVCGPSDPWTAFRSTRPARSSWITPIRPMRLSISFRHRAL